MSDADTSLVIAAMAYDGNGRRIRKAVTNTSEGELDYTHHYYHHGWSIAELRNGSNLIAKQHVWAPSGGGGYIDELVQVATNDDVTDATEQDCESRYYSVHNTQYNVLGLLTPELDTSGGGDLIGQTLVERYEYTPYGQRSVFVASTSGAGGGGGGDPLLTQPAAYSQEVASGGGGGGRLNDLGHQGLLHDPEINTLQNRRRDLLLGLGRYGQRDPLGYVDGMSVYQYIKSSPLQWFDWLGMSGQSPLTHTQGFGSQNYQAYMETSPPGSPNDFSEISIRDKNNNEVDRYKRTPEGWQRVTDHGGRPIPQLPPDSKAQLEINEFVEQAQRELDAFRDNPRPNFGQLKKAFQALGMLAVVANIFAQVEGACTMDQRCDPLIANALAETKKFQRSTGDDLDLKLSLIEMMRCILNNNPGLYPAIVLIQKYDFVADRNAQ